MTLEVQILHGYEMMGLELPGRQVVGVCDPKTILVSNQALVIAAYKVKIEH